MCPSVRLCNVCCKYEAINDEFGRNIGSFGIQIGIEKGADPSKDTPTVLCFSKATINRFFRQFERDLNFSKDTHRCDKNFYFENIKKPTSTII